MPDAPSSSAAWQTANLPQAGQQTGAAQQAAGQPATAPPQIAKRFATTIKPGETALPLSAGDKWQLAIRKQLTLGSLASPLISAGFGNLNNSRPHYGTDSGAFGERLGAAAQASGWAE